MDDIKKIQITAFNLKNPTKLHIIKYLSNKEASNQEIYEALKKTLTIKYRSAIHGALKDLQEMGLIEKYYDNLDSKIKYRLIVKKVNIDLEKLKIYFIQ
jgi:DNA-binding transcriptional ArsR family regulator